MEELVEHCSGLGAIFLGNWLQAHWGGGEGAGKLNRYILEHDFQQSRESESA